MRNAIKSRITSLALAAFVLVVSSMSCSKKPGTVIEDKPMLFDFERVIREEQSPKRVASLKAVQLGRKEAMNSRFERAAQEFSRALEIDPENPYAYYYFGDVRSKVQRFDEAIQLYEQAANYFAKEPEWKSQSLTLKGEIHEHLKEYEEAKGLYETALKVFPKNPRAKQGALRLKE